MDREAQENRATSVRPIVVGSDRKIATRLPGGFAVAACLGLLLAGILWRLPTLLQLQNYGGFAYSHVAYSDIVAFYFSPGVVSHHLPYLQWNVEYPVLTGLTIWITGFMPGVMGYFVANAVLLSACLVACYFLLARLGPGIKLSRFALAPALAFYAVLNWDAIALLALVVALYATYRRQFLWVGVSLAVGASAKLFPAFALPVLVAYALRQKGLSHHHDPEGHRWPNPSFESPAVQLLAGFVAVGLAINLPIALANWHGWSYFLSFQSIRGINPDAVWAHMPPIPDVVVKKLFADVFIFGLGWLAWRVYRGAAWQPAVLLSLLLFLLVTRDYSPQYDLWVLPLLAILACPLGLWLIFVVADVAYYVAIFLWYYLYNGGHLPIGFPTFDNLLGFAVWGREAALALLFLWGLALLRSTTLSSWWNRLAFFPSRA